MRNVFIASLVVALVSAIAFAQETESRTITTGDGAVYVVDIPRLVLRGEVREYWLSPDGDFVVALRRVEEASPSAHTPGNARTELVYLNLLDGGLRVIRTYPSNAHFVMKLLWAPKGIAKIGLIYEGLMFERDEPRVIDPEELALRPTVEIYEVGPSNLRTIGSHPRGDYRFGKVEPSLALGGFIAIKYTRPPYNDPKVSPAHIALLSAQGKVIWEKTIEVGGRTSLNVSDDGTRLSLNPYGFEGSPLADSRIVSLRTGEILEGVPLNQPAERAPVVASRFVLGDQEHSVQRGEHSAMVSGLWFQAAEPPPDDIRRVLVATQSNLHKLSEDGTRITFIRDGALYGCEVIRIHEGATGQVAGR